MKSCLVLEVHREAFNKRALALLLPEERGLIFSTIQVSCMLLKALREPGGLLRLRRIEGFHRRNRVKGKKPLTKEAMLKRIDRLRRRAERLAYIEANWRTDAKARKLARQLLLREVKSAVPSMRRLRMP